MLLGDRYAGFTPESLVVPDRETAPIGLMYVATGGAVIGPGVLRTVALARKATKSAPAERASKAAPRQAAS